MAEAVPTLKLRGAPGSPYTRKMRALLRYRHVPYRLIIQGSAQDRDLPRAKVSLLPTFFLPGADGREEAVVDSTPLIRRFEAEIAGRHAVPADPALAFLDYLLEDYGDEWLTKAMFHYRWAYPADVDKAAHVLPLWRGVDVPEEQLETVAKMIGERQISRLWVVGSNETTGPVIEASYERFLRLFDAHLSRFPYLMGRRPGASDFGVYGQLTQLALFDPTPAAVTLAAAPRVYAWVEIVEDLSGLEPTDDDWLSLDPVPDTLRALLGEVGRVYAPFLLANAAAIDAGAERVECTIDGSPWVQKPFPYQRRCLQWIRDEHAALADDVRARVDTALEGTGCEALFQ